MHTFQIRLYTQSSSNRVTKREGLATIPLPFSIVVRSNLFPECRYDARAEISRHIYYVHIPDPLVCSLGIVTYPFVLFLNDINFKLTDHIFYLLFPPPSLQLPLSILFSKTSWASLILYAFPFTTSLQHNFQPSFAYHKSFVQIGRNGRNSKAATPL